MSVSVVDAEVGSSVADVRVGRESQIGVGGRSLTLKPLTRPTSYSYYLLSIFLTRDYRLTVDD